MNGANLKIVSAILIAVCCLGIGATLRPEAFTYTKVYSVNGSDANAGCPMICRMNDTSNEKFCSCTGQIDNDTRFLVDGVIPTINVHQRNSWASMLYTVNTASTEYAIGFKFSHAFMVQEVELNIFLCPQWSILNTNFTIKIYSSHTFPAFTAKTEIANARKLFLGKANCNSSINVIIDTTSSNTTDTVYFIEFCSRNNLGGIYLGEVMFRDEVTSVENISSLIETFVSTKIYNITSSELSASSIPISPFLQPTTTSINKSSFLNINQLVSITFNLELNTMSSDFITMVKNNTKSSHPVALIGGLVVVIVILLLMLTIIGLLIAISTVRKKTNKKVSLHQSIPRSKSDTTNFEINNVINEDIEMNISYDYIHTVQAENQDKYDKINNKDKTPYEVPCQQYNKLRQQHSVNKENVPLANWDVRNCPAYDKISVNLQTDEATYDEIRESNISDQVYSKITGNKLTTTGLALPILQKDSPLQTLPDKSKDNMTDHICSNSDDSMYFVLNVSYGVPCQQYNKLRQQHSVNKENVPLANCDV